MAAMTKPSRRQRVGIVVAPRYFDTSSAELIDLAPELDVLHTQIRVGPDFGFTLEEIAETAPEVEACAASLAEAGAEMVIQLGTPFSTVHGWNEGLELQAEIEQRVGVPFEMMGLSVPAGVLALGHTEVALATTYYGAEWVSRYAAFAQEAGLRIVGSQSFVDQGHYASEESAFAASFDGFAASFVAESIAAVGDRYPEAEAIVVPGIPARLVDVLPDLEERTGRPVVSYFAIWWRCLARLGSNSPVARPGALLSLL